MASFKGGEKMKKLFWIVACAAICIQLAGCSGWTVRTETSTEPRVDQEISGNRGFLSGKPTAPPKEPTFTERRVYRIEVEIPPSRKKKKSPAAKKKSAVEPPKDDQEAWGNRGYIFGGPKAEEARAASEAAEVKKTPVALIKEKIAEVFKPAPEQAVKTQTYKVRKGDTLQKISRKFYGTTKKWPLLYKVNRDKLKSPNEVYPGQVLIIPEAGESKK